MSVVNPEQQLRGSGGQTDAGEEAGANPDVDSPMLNGATPGGDDSGGGGVVSAGDSAKRTKGGNVILRRVRTPDNVRPGESFEVEVDVSNGAAFIGPLEPDKCGLAPPGYKIEVVAIGPKGETQTKDDCITTTEVGTRDETYSFTFQAPETTGQWSVGGNVRMRGSGKETGRVGGSLTVTNSPPKDAAAESDSGSSRQDNGDGGGGTPDLPLSGDDLPDGNLVLGVIGLLAVAWIASSGAEVVG